MKLNNSKWKNITVSIIGFTLFILIFELMPRIIDLGSTYFDWLSNNKKLKASTSIEEELLDENIKNKNLKKMLKNIVSDYEQDKNISNVMNYLNNIADKSNITIASIKALKLKQNNNLWLQPVEIEFTSNYEELYNFIRFVENSSKVILLSNLNCKPKVLTKNKLDSKILLDVYLNL